MEKACHDIAKELVGGPRQKSMDLVFIGASKISANLPIKGHVMSPHQRLLRAIKEAVQSKWVVCHLKYVYLESGRESG